MFGMKKGAERFPLMILPQVSNVCNSKCTHCWFNANPSLRRRDGVRFMPPELLKKIIDEIALHRDPLPLLRITSTGEPFTMPGLMEILCYAAAEKQVRTAVITNGSLLVPEVSKHLIDANVEALEISADAADKETYEKIRGGLSFERLMDNIDFMLSYRNRTGSKTKILVSFVEDPEYIDTPSVEAFWRDRVDNVIVRKYLTYGQISESGYSEDTYLPPDDRTPCPYPFERMVICANGNVTFCNFDVSDGYYMGNVGEDTIENIWRNSGFEKWRELVIQKQFEKIPLCAKCNDWKYKSWTHNFFNVLKESKDRTDGKSDESMA